MPIKVARPQSAKPYSLIICGDCHQLRGDYPKFGPGAEQLCSCTPVRARRRTKPASGADHCTYVEFCRCCGLVLLDSGSRWSVWFCDACRPLIDGLNRAVGWMTAPIGRHSLMNGIGLVSPSHVTAGVLETFAQASVGMFDRIGELGVYATSVVERNLGVLGFSPGTDEHVAEYLAAVHRSDLRCDDAFFALLFNFALNQDPATRTP